MAFPERQDELIATHRAIQEEGLPYVLIGGWAISAYQVRTTMDLDMVIPDNAYSQYEELLQQRGWDKVHESDISNVYDGRFVEFKKDVSGYSISFDALVDAVRCRQTNAEWSYPYLEEHSVEMALRLAENLTAQVPEPALLFALKLHSGRKTDARDLVVVGEAADFDRVRDHVHRGETDQLRSQIDGVLTEIDDEHFRASFHGAFSHGEVDDNTVDAVQEFLQRLKSELEKNTR